MGLYPIKHEVWTCSDGKVHGSQEAGIKHERLLSIRKASAVADAIAFLFEIALIGSQSNAAASRDVSRQAVASKANRARKELVKYATDMPDEYRLPPELIGMLLADTRHFKNMVGHIEQLIPEWTPKMSSCWPDSGGK